MASVPQPFRVPSVRSSRRSRARRRLGGLALLLFVSGLLFVGVVSWQRDQTRIKFGVDSATEVSQAIGRYLAQTGHLPFQVEGAAKKLGGPLEIDYPDRNAIYRVDAVTEPFVLMAGARQGLLPPRDAGCGAIIYDRGKLRVEWLTMDQVAREQQRRDELLAPRPDPA